MKALKLTLKKCWYDRHLKDKKEEYREISPFWCARLLRIDERRLTKYEIARVIRIQNLEESTSLLDVIKFMNRLTFVYYDVMHAYNGGFMSDSLPNFQKKINNIKFGKGRKEWGGTENTLFVIECGEVVKNQ